MPDGSRFLDLARQVLPDRTGPHTRPRRRRVHNPIHLTRARHRELLRDVAALRYCRVPPGDPRHDEVADALAAGHVRAEQYGNGPVSYYITAAGRVAAGLADPQPSDAAEPPA